MIINIRNVDTKQYKNILANKINKVDKMIK